MGRWDIFVSHKRVGMEELGIKRDQDGSTEININEEGQRKSNHMDGLRGDKCSAHRRTPHPSLAVPNEDSSFSRFIVPIARAIIGVVCADEIQMHAYI